MNKSLDKLDRQYRGKVNTLEQIENRTIYETIKLNIYSGLLLEIEKIKKEEFDNFLENIKNIY